MSNSFEEMEDWQKKEEVERIQESIDFKYKKARNTLIWQNNKNKGNKKAQNFRYYQRKKFQREEMDRALRATGIEIVRERKQRISVISKTPIRIVGKKAQSSVNRKTNPILESVRMKMAEEAEKNFLARTEISEQEWKDYQAQQRAMGIESE
jgi:hypothetical protein